MNGRALPPNAQATLAVGSHLNLHVQIHGPAGVRVHNVYLFLGGPGYGSGPGDQPSGNIRILTHVTETRLPAQAITANWTAQELFGSSRLAVAVQFDFDISAQHVATEQQVVLALTVNA